VDRSPVRGNDCNCNECRVVRRRITNITFWEGGPYRMNRNGGSQLTASQTSSFRNSSDETFVHEGRESHGACSGCRCLGTTEQVRERHVRKRASDVSCDGSSTEHADNSVTDDVCLGPAWDETGRLADKHLPSESHCREKPPEAAEHGSCQKTTVGARRKPRTSTRLKRQSVRLELGESSSAEVQMTGNPVHLAQQRTRARANKTERNQ
jgi:hypothetical protein